MIMTPVVVLIKRVKKKNVLILSEENMTDFFYIFSDYEIGALGEIKFCGKMKR